MRLTGFLIPLLMLAGCGVSAANLRLAGQWRDAALALCQANRTSCSAGIPCVNAVLVLDQLGAGSKEMTAAGKACMPYGAPVSK